MVCLFCGFGFADVYVYLLSLGFVIWCLVAVCCRFGCVCCYLLFLRVWLRVCGVFGCLWLMVGFGCRVFGLFLCWAVCALLCCCLLFLLTSLFCGLIICVVAGLDCCIVAGCLFGLCW